MKTDTTPKPTWTPHLDFKTVSHVNFANNHRICKVGEMQPDEYAGAVMIGTLMIWMNGFRKEFANTFDEDLSDWIYMGYDGDDFYISADGPAIDLLNWLAMPLHHLVQAYGYEWRQDHNYCWTLVPASR